MLQLLECCDSKLRRDVTRNSIGPLPVAESSYQIACSLIARKWLSPQGRRTSRLMARETHHLATTAMADTGCQSCLASPSLMSSLHLSENELIPVSLVMHSASGTNLPILGATLLRIRVQLTGIETRQMVYFSNMATKLYLGLATCADLGLIPKEFPFRETTRRQGLTPGNTTSRPTYRGPADQTPPTRTPLTSAHTPYGNGQARGSTRMPTPPTGKPTGPPNSTPRQAPPTMATIPCSCPKRTPPHHPPIPSHCS